MTVPLLKNPIVLVHGFLGYDRIEMAGVTLRCYFPGIPEFLRAAGNRVLLPRLSPMGSVADRAGELRAFLDREAPSEPVHLIGHSMGGLDSRYLISCLGFTSRALSLTTIGTPHRGTAFADWGIQKLERLVKPVLTFLGMPVQAFYDLSTAGCRRFNEEVPDASGVRYFSVAGRYNHSWLCPEWYLPSSIVAEAEGPNDGIVSVDSATYGEQLDIWEGDHLSLVNWPSSYHRFGFPWRERNQDYAALVGRLADLGF